MKTIIYFSLLSAVIIFFSCDDSKQEKITSVEKKDSAIVRQDSITMAERKAQAQFIYGDIKFGDSRKTLLKKIDYFIKIGNYDYSVRSYFTNEEKGTGLYRLDFKTYIYDTANYFDTYIKGAWEELITIITSKYGEPDIAKSYPSLLSMQSGYYMPTHTWKIEDKEIIIGISEDESTFNTLLRISNTKMQDDLQKIQEVEEAANLKKSIDNF